MSLRVLALVSVLLLAGLLLAGLLLAGGATNRAKASTILNVDHRSLVARADLHYETGVSRSEEGLPIGNGRMGTLVWTTPTALRTQINRVDVFAANSQTNSFVERNSDYCCGVGSVDIDFVDYGEDVFPRERTVQHLSVYDGLLSVQGGEVSARALAWHANDVIAFAVEDTRKAPAPIAAALRMLRPPEVKTRSHTARSDLSVRGDRIILRQEFTEGVYYCGTAVAIAVVGRLVKPKRVGETELRLIAEPGQGGFTVLIASASTFDAEVDPATAALEQLDAAAETGFEALLEDNQGWWQEFWSRSFVHLTSDDGVADFVEANYNYFLYLMASTSRGKFPPKFNGMLWATGADTRAWGSQYWWHNVSSYYQGLLATNRPELMDPMFDMYSGMYDSCALAARQQWGSEGVFIPETVAFDGLAPLPENIAEEMRDLYLLRKPWEARSLAFRKFAHTKPPHSSRWNWKGFGRWQQGNWTFSNKGAGPFGHVTHILSSGAKIAFLFWQRYQFTQDEQWLRQRAYPMLQGVADFFLHFPNLKKGAEGKYHLHHVNNHEPTWGAQDAMEELAAIRGVIPLAIRASELLEVDEDKRGAWRELLRDLTPLPTNDDPDSLEPRASGAPRLWVNGRKPHWKGDGGDRSYHTIVPAIHYDLVTLETGDPDLVRIANDSLESLFPEGIGPRTKVDSLNPSPRSAALLGRASDIQVMVPNQIGAWGEGETVQPALYGQNVLRNRMTLQEGPQAADAEHLGRALDAVQLALLQSVPGEPGADTFMHVFPAWPKDWDASYTLAARGGFVVTSAVEHGAVQFVELQSTQGGECRLRNPWRDVEVSMSRDGGQEKALTGSLLRFTVGPGETVVLAPAGTLRESFKWRVRRER